MSTIDGQTDQQGPLFDITSAPSRKDEAICTLQQNLEEQIEKRKEERFYWVFGLLIGGDLLTFQYVNVWSAPLFVFVLEVIALICLGRKWGVDHFYTITERYIDAFIEKWPNKKNG